MNYFELANSKHIEISKAVLLAQKSLGAVTKSGDNPFYHSKYATLTDVIKLIKNIFNEAGIVILQPVDGDYIRTILLHAETGEFLSSKTRIVISKKDDPQAYGSAITYARRYALQSFLLIPTEDDDAESAMNRKPVKEATHKIVSSDPSVCGLHSLKMVNKIIIGKDTIYYHFNESKTSRCSGKGFTQIVPKLASINAERTGR